MKCTTCNKEIILTDRNGYPLYYLGAGPNNPEDAESYFCGPNCVIMKENRNVHRQTNH